MPDATRVFLDSIAAAGRYGLQLTKADNTDTVKRDAFEAGLIRVSSSKRATLTSRGRDYLTHKQNIELNAAIADN